MSAPRACALCDTSLNQRMNVARGRARRSDAHRCMLEATVVLEQCAEELVCTLHAHVVVEKSGAVDGGGGGDASGGGPARAGRVAAPAADPPPVDVARDSL